MKQCQYCGIRYWPGDILVLGKYQFCGRCLEHLVSTNAIKLEVNLPNYKAFNPSRR